MTEQQIDAELSRYEPRLEPGGLFTWSASEPDFDLPPICFVGCALFERLKGGFLDRRWRDYPTRAAAFADLRQAIRASGTNAAQE